VPASKFKEKNMKKNIFFLAFLKSLKKGVGSGFRARSGSGSISRIGSAPAQPITGGNISVPVKFLKAPYRGLGGDAHSSGIREDLCGARRYAEIY
jgi:hypothetical protein